MLQKYISVEEKDAHHCIKHFVKIRSRDTQAAQEMLPATIEHITLIRYCSVSSYTVSTCSTVSYLQCVGRCGIWYIITLSLYHVLLMGSEHVRQGYSPGIGHLFPLWPPYKVNNPVFVPVNSVPQQQAYCDHVLFCINAVHVSIRVQTCWILSRIRMWLRK